MTVIVGAFPNTCAVDDAAFITSTGGCKQVSTGKVWSLPSTTTMTWMDAIWDSTLAANAAADADDASRTNDYDPATVLTGNTDSSTMNYCHALSEGGKTDWRVPTCAEIVQLYAGGAGAKTHFNTNSNSFFNNYFFTSTSGLATGACPTSSANSTDEQHFNLSTGVLTHALKTTTVQYVYCIRP